MLGKGLLHPLAFGAKLEKNGCSLEQMGKVRMTDNPSRPKHLAITTDRGLKLMRLLCRSRHQRPLLGTALVDVAHLDT